MSEHKWTKDHIGSRVVYSDRSGKSRAGTVRDVLESVQQVDVDLDDMNRARYYVPGDMLRLVPDELGDVV